MDHIHNMLKWLEPYRAFKPDGIRANPISAWLGHGLFGYLCAKELKPLCLVELGTHGGYSFFSFCEGLQDAGVPDGARFYAVDTWEGDPQAGFYGEAVFQSVKDYTEKHYASFAVLKRMLFDQASGDFPSESIDLLHIDGLHSFESVRHDFELWFPKVRPGGIILFHDICERTGDFGVWKLWEELKQRFPEHFEFHHYHGLGVLRKPGASPLQSDFLNSLLNLNREEDAEKIRSFFAESACGCLLNNGRIVSTQRSRHYEHPFVSFIVPVYSIKGNYLPQCLDSILQVISGYHDAEILVLNDQSPDNTAEVIAEYAKRLPHFIRVIPSDRRLGQAAARAIMVEQARGKYIIPCDHDDVLLPFDLGKSIEMLERHPEYFGSYAGKFYFSGRGYEHQQDGGSFSAFRLFLSPKINVNASILRRDDVLAAGNFRSPGDAPDTLGEDVLLLVRMCLKKKFLFEPFAPRCLYRVHANQITRRKRAELSNTGQVLKNYLLGQYRETAESIFHGVIPPITPENDAIVMALLGVISMVEVDNFGFAADCCREGIALHPEDYGAWVQLLFLALRHSREDVWNEIFPEACYRFRNDLYAFFELADIERLWYQARGLAVPPAVSARFEDLHSKYVALPVHVANHPLLKKRRRGK